jgi:hypothetical protein
MRRCPGDTRIAAIYNAIAFVATKGCRAKQKESERVWKAWANALRPAFAFTIVNLQRPRDGLHFGVVVEDEDFFLSQM